MRLTESVIRALCRGLVERESYASLPPLSRAELDARVGKEQGGFFRRGEGPVRLQTERAARVLAELDRCGSVDGAHTSSQEQP